MQEYVPLHVVTQSVHRCYVARHSTRFMYSCKPSSTDLLNTSETMQNKKQSILTLPWVHNSRRASPLLSPRSQSFQSFQSSHSFHSFFGSGSGLGASRSLTLQCFPGRTGVNQTRLNGRGIPRWCHHVPRHSESIYAKRQLSTPPRPAEHRRAQLGSVWRRAGKQRTTRPCYRLRHRKRSLYL